MGMDVIRLGIVEPCVLNRDLLVCAFSSQSDMEVIFAAHRIEDLPSDDASLEVQVLLLRMSFAGVVGQPVALLGPWRRFFPNVHIVVLSESRVFTTITSLLRWGVDGYMVWDTVQLDEVLDGIRAVNEGSLVVCSEAQGVLYRDSFNTPRLTATELEVVCALTAAHEYSRKEAAAILNMSYKTFNVHMRNIALKLDIYGGSQSVVERCRELGFIDDLTHS